MNLILCVLAVLILLNVVNSEKSLEEETEEMKRMLEQFKVKLESMKHKTTDYSQLQSNFGKAVTEAAKFIETLDDTLKVFQLQKIDKEKGQTEAGKTAKQKPEEAEKNTPKEKLKRVQEKVQAVIKKVDAMISGAKTDDRILSFTSVALHCAGQLDKALHAALKVEEKDVDIKNLTDLATELYRMIENIQNYIQQANLSNIGSNAAEIATAVANIVESLFDFLKINEQQVIERKDEGKGKTKAEKNTPKEKLEFVKEKVQNVITTLHTIKNVTSNHLLRLINLTISYADQLREALDAALKGEAKAIDIQNLRNLAKQLGGKIEIIGNFTKLAKHPEKANEFQQSAFRTVTELGAILENLQADLS